MIINQLDLGASHPWSLPVVGQVTAVQIVEGYEPTVWSRGSIDRQQTVRFWLQAWQGLGGAVANSRTATLYLLKQLEELASNRDQQPVYIQWNATAQPGAPLNATELHDGWYIIDSLAPNYAKFVVSGIVECTMTVTEVAAAPPRSVAMAYMGGALSSNFSGGATNLLALPLGSTALEAGISRAAAEGSISLIPSPAASPEPLTLSATIANWFKGGVHVYDTINTGSNPVPTSGGTFVNANWVEVFFTDHDFQGDCVITNGLQLLLFQAGAANQVCLAYLWSTGLAVANWQQWATLRYADNATNNGTSFSYSLVRVGAEESGVVVINGTSQGQVAQTVIRLQRGRLEGRIDFRPLTQIATSATGLYLSLVAAPKILYDSASVADAVKDTSPPTLSTDYGYGAGFIANSAYPFLFGFLYQNQPSAILSNPFNNTTIGYGDTTSLAINATRAYGIFALPYGVSGSYSTANLQAEAEGFTLGGGFVSVADPAASALNAAKLPSGTAAGATADGVSWTPAPGIYQAWARVKVTSNASGTTQLRLGVYDSTSGWVANQFSDYAPSAFTTSYLWYKLGKFTPIAGHLQRFNASGITNAATTDFFIDEFVLTPLSLTAANTGPQDIWQQFMYDRSVRLIRP